MTRRLLLAMSLLLLPATLASQDTPQSIRAKQDVLWARMQDSITAVVHQTDAVVGIAIVDLSDERSYFLNADAVFPTASTIKIAVLLELWRQSERAASGGAGARLGDLYTVRAADVVAESNILGGLTPGVSRVTNRDLATMVVAVSDNGATNVLIDRVGIDNVNAMLAQAGLKDTRLRRHMMDVRAAREGRENTATPRELTFLLRALHHGKLLSKPMTADLVTMLSTPKESYIPRLLPPGLQIANKPGSLDGVRNDAGIVYVPNRPFAIAVMTTFGRDDANSELAIARIARAAWSYFDRIGQSSPLGRVVR